MTFKNLEEQLVPKSYFQQGNLWGWGDNNWGQLGDNTQNNSKSSPIQTVAGGSNWKLVAGGGYHTAAIKTDGTLWTWGYNQYGMLGDNTTTTRVSPVQTVAGGTNWKSVSCGRIFMAAIKTDGTLWTWGNNGVGQLGTSNTTQRSSPAQTVAGGTNWKSLCVHASHVTAIKTDGTLWTWGGNVYGQLGDNTTAHKSSPVQTIAGGTNWKLVAGGGYHTVAIKTDGTLWCWGLGTSGQLGDNTTSNKSSPVQTIASGTNWKLVAGGGDHTVAIKTDGTLWSWGGNASGQLGDNTRTPKSSPVQTVAGGTNWKEVAASGMTYQVSRAIKTDGTLWSWGYNLSGQLGDNTITSKSSPIQTVAGGTNWKMVASGQHHTMAIKG